MTGWLDAPEPPPGTLLGWRAGRDPQNDPWVEGDEPDPSDDEVTA